MSRLALRFTTAVLGMLVTAGSAAAADPVVVTPSVPTASVAFERLISVAPTSLSGRAWEPIVATNPTDPSRVAVIYARRSGSLRPVVRISHDGGRTWHTASGMPGGPWGTDQHAVLAWGPGPTSGSRLYYANMHVVNGAHRLSTSYSDNEGRTWSKLYIERRTPAWIGGFPDITVDRNPTSPNFGVVYIAYNWLANASKGPGLRVLASADYGKTWKPVEVPVALDSGWLRRQLADRLPPANRAGRRRLRVVLAGRPAGLELLLHLLQGRQRQHRSNRLLGRQAGV
jgi:hypothetical protein